MESEHTHAAAQLATLAPTALRLLTHAQATHARMAAIAPISTASLTHALVQRDTQEPTVRHSWMTVLQIRANTMAHAPVALEATLAAALPATREPTVQQW
jgi:hypothetical protein